MIPRSGISRIKLGSDKHLIDLEIALHIKKLDKDLIKSIKNWGFSRRETQLVLLAVAGHSSRESASICRIDYRTAGFHFTMLYKKLGIRNKHSIVALMYNTFIKKVYNPYYPVCEDLDYKKLEKQKNKAKEIAIGNALKKEEDEPDSIF